MGGKLIKAIAMLFGLVALATAFFGYVAIFSLDNIRLEATPLSAFISEDNLIKFKLGITNTWLTILKPETIQMEYLIMKKGGSQIIEHETEQLKLRGGISFNRGLLLPQTTDEGKYILIATARYKDQTAKSSFDFQIGASKLEFAGLELTADIPANGGIEIAAPDIVDVVIQGYKAVPEKIVIKPGTTVRWTNKDDISHTVTGAGFDSGPIHKGDSFMFMFNESGLRYIYKSTIHSSILGEIITRSNS